MHYCRCGGRTIKIDEEFVCEKCGVVLGTHEYPINQQIIKEGRLGSYLGLFKEDVSLFDGLSEGNGTYIKKYSDLFLRPKEEKVKSRLEVIAERLENQLSLPRFLREEAIDILLKSGKSATEAALAYAYVVAARRRGNWYISWHVVQRKLRELGYRSDISDIFTNDVHVDYLNYLPSLAEKVSFFVKEKVKRKGKNPFIYFNELLEEARELFNKFDKYELEGHSPYSLAVTGIFLAEVELAKRERRRPFFTQQELAKLANISIYTIRETSSFMRRLLGDLNRPADLKPVIKVKVKD